MRANDKCHPFNCEQAQSQQGQSIGGITVKKQTNKQKTACDHCILVLILSDRYNKVGAGK